MNAVEIEAALSELTLQPFDAAEFPFAFLTAFGNKDTTLKRLRTGNNNASDVPGANNRYSASRMDWTSQGRVPMKSFGVPRLTRVIAPSADFFVPSFSIFSEQTNQTRAQDFSRPKRAIR